MHSLLLSSGLIIRGIRTEIATVRTLERRNSRFILAHDPNFTFTHYNHLAKVVKNGYFMVMTVGPYRKEV